MPVFDEDSGNYDFAYCDHHDEYSTEFQDVGVLEAYKIISILVPVSLRIRYFPDYVQECGKEQVANDKFNERSIKIIQHEDTQNHT